MPWRARVPPAVAWSGLALCVVLAFALIGDIVSAIAPTPSGPPLSSYATTPKGLAAWAELLERDGHTVSQIRTPLASARLPAEGTLVILGGGTPVLSAAGSGAVARFVAGGGWLVISGPRIQRVPSAKGRVIGVGDPAFLQNGKLDHGNNAFRALRIAGPPSRPVLFDEVVHGYGPAIGLAALPSRWWFAIVLLALALCAWGLSRAVRLGGSDPVAATVARPRTAYVDAMAQTLVRTNGSSELALRARAVATVEENFQEIR